MLFKELVAVRYKAAMERKTPLFRTLQWSWFAAAMLYAHGDSIGALRGGAIKSIYMYRLAPVPPIAA